VNPMLLPKKERVRRFSIFTHQSSIMWKPQTFKHLIWE
jgi:hypothetical protein